MGDLLHSTVTYFPSSPIETFRLFGQARGGGWILGSQVSSARVGAVLETGLPFAVLNDDTSRGTARVTAITPFTRIVLEHESPWSGETVLSFSSHGSGTRVISTSTLTSEAIGWINQQLDIPAVDESDDGDVAVGLITDLSGQTSVFGRSIINCAQLAVREINHEGGIHGRKVRLAHVDESTDPSRARAALNYLTAQHGVAAVIGAHTSQSLDAISPTLLNSRQLYLFAPVNEGGPRRGNIFRLGESAEGQLRHAIPRLAQLAGGESWYLLGNDYSWPRTINDVGRQLLLAGGHRVVGERYLPMGRLSDVDAVVEEVVASGARVVLSSLVGYASIEFERAVDDAGLRDRLLTLSMLLDENTLDHLGGAAEGVWSSMSYFARLETPANQSFLGRYKSLWDRPSAPPSALSVSVYDSLHLWARAARRAGSLDPDEVARCLPGLDFDGPRGRVQIAADGTSTFDYYLAQAQSTELRITESFGR